MSTFPLIPTYQGLTPDLMVRYVADHSTAKGLPRLIELTLALALNKDGYAEVSIAELARLSACSTSTVQRTLKELREGSRWLAVSMRREDGGYDSTRYFPMIPDDLLPHGVKRIGSLFPVLRDGGFRLESHKDARSV